jgi:hypothetical protein
MVAVRVDDILFVCALSRRRPLASGPFFSTVR